jgi:excisionase family DNA binding protein
MSRKIGGYIRPSTAAHYLGIPVEEVHEMLESGELPGLKIEGRWRVPLDKLEEWLDEEVSRVQLNRLAVHLKDVAPEKIEDVLKEDLEEEPG